MDLASAEAEIRHVFGDTPITEASIGAAPPDILVKLSGWGQHTDLYNMDQHRGQTFAHARVVRRRSRRTSTDDDDSDTSLVGILHNFHCEHCCLLCFLALVLDCDNNSCKDI